MSPQALVSQMNRATAEVQKDLSQEEGFAPVLAWVKALVDELLAREFDAPDLAFAWTPEDSTDPQAQEATLSSYTSRGILTLNEARAALGRPPLPDPQADRAMALTGAGYVPLGQTAPAGGEKGRAFLIVTQGHLISDRLLIDWRERKYTCEPLHTVPDLASPTHRHPRLQLDAPSPLSRGAASPFVPKEPPC